MKDEKSGKVNEITQNDKNIKKSKG